MEPELPDSGTKGLPALVSSEEGMKVLIYLQIKRIIISIVIKVN